MLFIKGLMGAVRYVTEGYRLMNFRYITRKTAGLVGMIRKKIRWVAACNAIQIERKIS